MKLTYTLAELGKRNASVRAVRSSYVTLRCTHALSLAGLGVHVSSLSEPMNAIILAQVELNQNSIHCFSFPTHPTLRADLPWRCPPRYCKGACLAGEYIASFWGHPLGVTKGGLAPLRLRDG